MNCPKCKCPNPPGALYCEMCYESFNRSAADNYIRTLRRQRHAEERRENQNSLKGKWGGASNRLAESLNLIDWGGIARHGQGLLLRYKKTIGIAALTLAAVVVITILHSPGIRFRTLGHRLAYAFPSSAPHRYLAGFQTDFHSWSEWNHQMDTPMEEFHDDEIGNILLERVAGPNGTAMVGLRPKEWIRIRRGQSTSASQRINLQDPSVAPLDVTLDQKGALTRRPAALTARMGRAAVLLLPVFPARPLRLGNRWDEPVQWIQTVSDWKIYWSGQLHWTLESAGDCPEGLCANLSYKGELRPQLWAGAAWASGALGHPVFQATPVEGKAIFDLHHHQLISNTLSYETLMRVPIQDLGRIPWDLRIGRRVRGVPGDLVIQFKNRYDIHEN